MPNDPAPKGQAAAIRDSHAKADQSHRLAAALRDNLKRRKAQMRARREPGPDPDKG